MRACLFVGSAAGRLCAGGIVRREESRKCGYGFRRECAAVATVRALRLHVRANARGDPPVEDGEERSEEQRSRSDARKTVFVQLVLVITGAVMLWTVRPPLDESAPDAASASSEKGALIRVGVWVSYFVFKYLFQLAEEFFRTLP